jgi:phosphate transport system substrate-binding protein
VNESIALVVPSGPSRASEALTGTLSSISSEWKGKVGTSSRPKWPGFAIRTEGDSGVALQLLRLPYSLGYMPLTNTFKVSTAFIENDAGHFVAPSTNSVQAAMDDAVGKGFEEMGSRTKVLFLSIVDRKNTSDAYPIARLSYMAFEARALDCLTLEFVVYLLYWAWTDRRAAEIALQLSFAPISSGIRHSLLSLLQTLSCYAHDANETKQMSTQISNSMTILERVKYSISPIVMGAGASSP